MASEFFTGDTIRIRVTFKDNLNQLADADSNEVYLKVYDGDDPDTVITDSTQAARQSAGIYYYDYTMPDTPMKLILEMKGLFGTHPQLERTRIKVKFK